MSQGFTNQQTYAVLPPTIQKFTSGSGTYTLPSGAKYIVVEMVGGGGGGGGSSTVGDGGTGGTGGNTTFGTSLLTANGGAGGTGVNPSVGGAGGTTTLNSPAIGINVNGQQGSDGEAHGGYAINQISGCGGNTPLSGAGSSVGSSSTSIVGRTAVANTGSGGSGAAYNRGTSGSSFWGAGGGAGGYIQAIINAPSATYSYSVGAGGTAGTAGTSGSAGGAGASGVIIVTEYYDTIGIPSNLTLPIPVNQGGTGLTSGGPAFSAIPTASQNITANTLTKVTLDNEIFDTNNNFASSRFTPTVAGYYQLNGNIRGTGTTMTLLQICIYKNGSYYNNVQINTNTPGYNTQACISEIIYLNGSTDYVELYGAVYCASGASFNYADNAVCCHFNGCYLRGN